MKWSWWIWWQSILEACSVFALEILSITVCLNMFLWIDLANRFHLYKFIAFILAIALQMSIVISAMLCVQHPVLNWSFRIIKWAWKHVGSSLHKCQMYHWDIKLSFLIISLNLFPDEVYLMAFACHWRLGSFKNKSCGGVVIRSQGFFLYNMLEYTANFWLHW